MLPRDLLGNLLAAFAGTNDRAPARVSIGKARSSRRRLRRPQPDLEVRARLSNTRGPRVDSGAAPRRQLLRLTSQDGYDSLYDFLIGQAGVQPGPLGAIKQRGRAQVAALTFGGNRTAAAAPAARRDASVSEVYNRALRQLADSRLQEALDGLSSVIDIDPTFAFAYYNRGLARYLYRDSGHVRRLDAGTAARDRRLRSRARAGFRDAIVYRNRGNVYSRKGDVPNALADYAQAIALEPTNAIAYLNRAEVHENTLQREHAIADYKAVLKLVTEAQYQERARARLLALGVKVPRASSRKGRE